ncbi:uncharacterized protein LOC106511737, partial [Austrofundulus limnaeus]|uniref:Gypsy retrotransposon integrase-like protein 1 n=1 Tax=Austrofundulus limnaeus TaxID=52670 RepID=A0A2I4AK93_AUSLI
MRSTLSSVLIGTNTLDVLYEKYAEIAPQRFESLPYGYKVVLKTLEIRKKQSADSSLGEVRLHSRDLETISAGQTKVLQGSVSCRTFDVGKWVMVESPKSSSLPGGILVTDSLVSLPPKLSRCIPVTLKNESQHDITLSPKAVIAEIHVVKSVQPVKTPDSDSLTKPDQKPNLDFDFTDSPVPNEWKERITEKLSSMPEVFAMHELDFGRTDRIKHHITLSDETPFKHRPRPIHPQDIEAVRTHLQQLLDAEVIRESESPFSSPIVVVRKKDGDVRLSAKLDATSYRWLAALSTFDFQLQYRAGKQNQDADGLSRRPHGKVPDDTSSQKELERIQQFTKRHLSEADYAHLNGSTIKAICEKHLVHEVISNHPGETSPSTTLVVSLAHHPKALPQSFEEEDQLGGLPVIPPLSPAELRDKQNADPCIGEVLRQVESGEKPPPSLRKELPELGLLLREWNKLEVSNGVLYRRRQEGAQTHYQLVLPEALRCVVLKSLHDDMGHMGIERTLDLVRKRFYWPKMSTEVENKVRTCNRCIRRKTMPEKAAPLINIVATRPLELVCMDFLSVEPDSSNTKDILVITDHFTKYAVAVPTPNQKARTVAKTLWDHFFVHYGIPERLHSDQGPDFNSRTIKELCDLIGTKKIRTTPYHPRGNPVERFNRTLLNMLGTLENQKKSHWREYVKPLVHAYNCTKNETTGFSPYELMFGRQPRLPVDLAFGLPVNHKPGSHSQYVHNLKSQLEDSYRVATENATKTANRNKARFDKHVVDSTLKEGDRVLVRNVRLRGKHKLADRWESDVYVVLRQSGDVPVYVVKPETRDGPQRTLHRDLLLPCGFLPMTLVESEINPPKAVRRPRTRQHSKNNTSNGADGDESQSDSEEYHYHRNLKVDTLGFNLTSEPMEYLPERIEPEPDLTTVEQNPPDVAKAFPENSPVETYDLDLPDPEEKDL